MNLSAAVMLVAPDQVRPVRVLYDPDVTVKNYTPTRVFKCVDKTIKKGDLVICQTSTRHGYTVVEVAEVDFPVDFEKVDQWDWIVGKVDIEAIKSILSMEADIVKGIALMRQEKMRQELLASYGAGGDSIRELQAKFTQAGQPTIASPRGVEHPIEEPPERPSVDPYAGDRAVSDGQTIHRGPTPPDSGQPGQS